MRSRRIFHFPTKIVSNGSPQESLSVDAPCSRRTEAAYEFSAPNTQETEFMASNQELESNPSRPKPSGDESRGINAFNKLKKKWWKFFEPQNLEEEQVVAEIIPNLWRLRNLRQLEAEKSAPKKLQ